MYGTSSSPLKMAFLIYHLEQVTEMVRGSLFHCSTHYLPFPSLPSCHIPNFDTQTHFWVRVYHLDLGVYTYIAALYESCLSSYSGFYNGPEKSQYQGD
jgi:hypothetical protein